MRVCLVGATHPCHNPRLVREADTLSAAGHDVRVIAPSVDAELAARDDRLVARRRWRFERADLLGAGALSGWPRRVDAARRRGARLLFRATGVAAVDSYLLAAPRLRRLAVSEPADWFIAHAHAALPVAAMAANRFGARLGFDCEDLLAESDTDPRDVVRVIEDAFLPRCHYVSVPSRSIATRLSEMRGRRNCVVLYNAVPLASRNGLRPPEDRPPSRELRVHWFSQTIGPGRGLEDAVDACARLGPGVELHLRGTPSSGFRGQLERRAAAGGVRLHFLPRVDPDDLPRTFESFDVGLAVERAERPSTALTASNKLFAYASGGLAVAASDTPGQREILVEHPAIGFLYPSGDVSALASGLGHWQEQRGALRAAQQAAWQAGGGPLSWDALQQVFLRLIESS